MLCQGGLACLVQQRTQPLVGILHFGTALPLVQPPRQAHRAQLLALGHLVAVDSLQRQLCMRAGLAHTMQSFAKKPSL